TGAHRAGQRCHVSREGRGGVLLDDRREVRQAVEKAQGMDEFTFVGLHAAAVGPQRQGAEDETAHPPVPLSTARTVSRMILRSSQGDQCSMYQLSYSARVRMQVSPRRPWMAAHPVSPTGTRWRCR